MGLLALAIAGCGSSNKTPPVDASPSDRPADSPVDSPVDGPADVRADASDTGGTDVRDTATDRGNDLPVDRPNPVDAFDAPLSICTGVAPAHQVIADFQGFDNSAFGSFGQDPLIGNTYVVATGINPEDFTAQAWHISGLVYGRQDFFGLSWSCTAAPSGGCTMDASQYAGIQFTIKGSAGPSRNINFTVGRNEDDTAIENAMCGTCVVPGDASSSQVACHGPRVRIALPTDPTVTTTVTLHWTDFAGGSPQISADPHQLTGMLWYFDDPTADGGTVTDAGPGLDGGPTDGPPTPGAPSYGVDLTLDNIQFVPF